MARKRSFTAAVPVSTLQTFEPIWDAAQQASFRPLEAAPQMAIPFTVKPIADGTVAIGWVPEGIWWDAAAIIRHTAPAAGTYGVSLQESAPGEGDAVTLLANTTDATAAVGAETTTANFAPLAERRLLLVTTASVTAGAELVFTLLVTPTVPKWS